VKEEIIDVVNPISQGSVSLYVLIPEDVRTRKKITKESRFVVILAENGDIIYRKKEA